MKFADVILMLGLGLAIWVGGTIYYAYVGRAVLETSAQRYWIAFATSPLISALMCIVIVRWRGIAYSEWASAMLLLALPGMIGEAVVLSHLSTFMPRIQESSGGKYGAFLFATYGVVLGMAEAVSLAARH